MPDTLMIGMMGGIMVGLGWKENVKKGKEGI